MSEAEKQVVIVGASAAGLRCASRLKRLEPGWTITVVEQGRRFSVAACGMPYVLSGDIPNAPALLKTGDGVVRDEDFFEDAKGVEVLAGCRALAIDPQARSLRIQQGDEQRDLAYDELVISTGARARKLPEQPVHPRVHAFHTYGDLVALEQGLKSAQIRRVIIIGAGLVGCELAEALRGMWDAEVVLIEAGPHPLPMLLDAATGGIVAAELLRQGVDLRCGAAVEGMSASDDAVTVRFGGATAVADAAVVCFGLEPAVDLAASAGLRVGPTGALGVDERLATNVAHIWAAGDCIEVRDALTDEPVYRPLGSLANRQGRTLANVLAGRNDRFPPVVGATAVKVFDLNVATSGLTLARARRSFSEAQAAWLAPHDRAHYWPQVADLFIQLVFDAASRRVLGVQVVGPGECAKRADVATGLMARGADLAAFTQLEHAYAPPYAPALEPLAVVAMVAENRLDGLDCCPPADPAGLSGARILDVRHDHESALLPVPADDVTLVDQLEVAERLDELRAGPWTVVCARGLRSAEVARFLNNRGVVASYVAGGMAWLGALNRIPERE